MCILPGVSFRTDQFQNRIIPRCSESDSHTPVHSHPINHRVSTMERTPIWILQWDLRNSCARHLSSNRHWPHCSGCVVQTCYSRNASVDISKTLIFQPSKSTLQPFRWLIDRLLFLLVLLIATCFVHIVAIMTIKILGANIPQLVGKKSFLLIHLHTWYKFTRHVP